MTRPIEEVVVSQGAMVKRLGDNRERNLMREQLERGLTAHRKRL